MWANWCVGSGESIACTTPSLRPHEGFLAVCQTGKHHRVSKLPFHTRGSLVLPPSPDGVDLIQVLKRSMSQGQSAPRRDLENLHTFSAPLPPALPRQSGVCLCHSPTDGLSNGSMTLVDHVETIGPTLWLVRVAIRNPHPPNTKGSGGHAGRMITRFWAGSGECGTDMPTICESWLSAKPRT